MPNLRKKNKCVFYVIIPVLGHANLHFGSVASLSAKLWLKTPISLLSRPVCWALCTIVGGLLMSIHYQHTFLSYSALVWLSVRDIMIKDHFLVTSVVSTGQTHNFGNLKLKLRKYPSKRTNYIISHSTILQYNHNICYGSYVEKKYWTRKTMVSTGLPYLQFSMNTQGFSPARLTWPAYDSGRKRENSSAWKHRIIVAPTCRRSVEFGRYVTWVWMANCVPVMTKNAAFV